MMAASGHAGVLIASWTAPTTNTDGSALTNLAFYRLYYSTSDSPCPGSTFFEVASPTSMPQRNQTVSFQLTGLKTASVYRVSITAVTTGGKQSNCSDVAGAIARDDSTATSTAQDHSGPTQPLQDHSATTPTVQDHSVTTPTVQDDSATTPTVEDHSAIAPPPQEDSATAPPDH